MNKNQQYWPLCADVFTFSDKLKISKFLFTEKIWTYGKHIEAYENLWKDYLRTADWTQKNFCVMVSSGSTANELIALRRKWELQQEGSWPRKNKVIFPVNTWISSVSPWINFGFEPIFVDVDPSNLNVNWTHLEQAFQNAEKNTIGTVFYTALLGFFGDLFACKNVTEHYGAKFLMDNCEASFSSIQHKSTKYRQKLLSFTTSSTSLFYSHFTTSGTEGGMIFCQNEEEYEWYKMARSHGMTRGMPDKYKNPNVNPDFDFYLMGSNYRSSNLQAYMASLDFERGYKLCNHRQTLFNAFYLFETKNVHSFHNKTNGVVVPLALPIIFKDAEKKNMALGMMREQGIATRPIIGGCLLHHTAFRRYGSPTDFPVANNAHHCGIYLGLHKNVTEDMVEKLREDIYKL